MREPGRPRRERGHDGIGGIDGIGGALGDRLGGPGLLLVPLGIFLIALLWQRARSWNAAPGAPPTVEDPGRAVPGLRGEGDDGAGGWLVARLSPLHPEAERQAFEARALERRLGLAAGEPWRLELLRQEVEGGGLASLALERLAVVDAKGTALRPLAAPEPAEFEPLRTLLAPPAEGLAPGRAVTLVLWGRAPATDVRLEGLPASLALEPTTWRRDELGGPLARLPSSSPTDPEGKASDGASSIPAGR